MNSWRAVSGLVTLLSLAVTGAFAQAAGSLQSPGAAQVPNVAQAPGTTQAPSAAQASSAWSFPDFSARQVFEAGGEEVSYKVYRSGSRVRIETNSKLAILYDVPNDHVYRLTIYPNGKQGCISMTMAQAQMLPSPLALLFGVKVKRTPAGTAIVDGRACDVEDVEVTTADGKTVKSRVWGAKDLKGVPVKIESQLPQFKLTTSYRDVAVGSPDAALVTPPGDCVPFDKMGEDSTEGLSKTTK